MHTAAEDDEGLIGRERALDRVASVLAGVAAGRRGVLVVEGEAGIGKSSLVRTALARTSATVVWARGDEAEVELDHGIIDQLARSAPIRAEDRSELAETIGADPLQVGAWMVRLLDRVALDPARPLVVVVDDAQWADLSSLHALAFAARRLQRDPALLCLVLRPEGMERLPTGLRRLLDDEGERLVLEPLDREAVRTLAAERTGHALTTSAAARLHEHTGGNPLHLRTLLDELPVEAIEAPGDLPSPRAFGALVLARLDAAGPSAASLAAAVAVLGEPAPVALATELAGLTSTATVLDRAVAHGVLTSERDASGRGLALGFPHPLVRAAVLDGLAPGRRAELHRRAGDLVPGAAGLRHRLHGALGPDAALWDDAVRAARDHADAGAHGTAASLLRAATSIAPTEEERESTLHEAVEQLLLAGRIDDARRLRDAVAATADSPRRRYVEGRLAYVIGPRREARTLLVDAWSALVGSDAHATKPDDVALEDRELAGRVAAMLATASIDRADGDAALTWGRLAVDLDPDAAARASAAHMLAGAWALSGRYDEGLADLDRLCASVVVEGRPSSAAVADAHSARGLLRLWTHDLERAAVDLERSLAAYDRAGSFVGRETARSYLAEVCYRQGRWDDALLLAGLSASIVDDTDQVWMAALPHATAARPCAARGESAREHVELATAAAAQVGGGVGAGLALVAGLEVAACERDLEGVLETGTALQAARRPVDDRIAPWRATFAEALALAGEVDAAERVALHLAADAGTPLLRADAARAAAAVAAARGDGDALDAAAAALAEDARAVGPYPRARLELVLGRAWRRRGERRRAVDVLEASLARFEALGARPWVSQVEAELVASGLRPRRRDEPAAVGLTPQEQAVAQLVARGRTNREVAAELIVSAKTVEHHLTRIYAKVGVRSRTELAARLAAEP